MKKEKVLSILLVFLFVFLSACTATTTQAPAEDPKAPAEPEKAAAQPEAAKPADTEAPKKVKVAMVLSGKVSDGGFNANAYSGLMAAEKELDIETAYSEDVQTADAETAFRDYASKGYDIVIGHGSQYADVILTVAQEFPDVYFAITNADVKAENVAGLDTKNEETGYLSGYVLGKLSKSKKIAYLGSVEIVALLRSEEGFRLGAKDACPDCEVITAWTGSFSDMAKAKETVLALTEKGVDGLHNSAGLGAIDGCVEYGCYVTYMGGSENLISRAPENMAVSLYHSLDVVIMGIVKEVVEGKFVPNLVRIHGFDTGVYGAELNLPLLEKNLSAEDITDIKNVIKKLENKEIQLPHLSALSSK